MFENELKNILNEDPLGLLDVKPQQSNTITANQRLVSSFEEINSFVGEHGREPEKSTDINERRLANRLAGLRDSAERAIALKEYDMFNLLGDMQIVEPPSVYSIESIDDILGGDALGLLDGPVALDDPEDIFFLRHVEKSSPTQPDLANSETGTGRTGPVCFLWVFRGVSLLIPNQVSLQFSEPTLHSHTEFLERTCAAVLSTLSRRLVHLRQ